MNPETLGITVMLIGMIHYYRSYLISMEVRA